jgi:AraC-like DNA-binding protein
MSPTSFCRHFNRITGMSPLQFQKRLRLYEAQRLLLTEGKTAETAAYEVGYESSTQFNREYKRQFGEPPHRDIERLLVGSYLAK